MDKSKNQIKSIDNYINSCPVDVRSQLQTLKQLIKEIAPNAKETIKYHMPTFVLNGNLVHFAAFKNHIGFYPTPSPIVAFAEELSDYKTSKGAIQFPVTKPLPLSLIRKIVDYRVKENLKK